MARLNVTFKPLFSTKNVTGSVWYCKGLQSSDPCSMRLRVLDQLVHYDPAEPYAYRSAAIASPIPCQLAEVMAYARKQREQSHHSCYYNSRDPAREDIWLSMPSPSVVDHFWFQHFFGYPVLFILSGMLMLSVFIACLTLEEIEVQST